MVELESGAILIDGKDIASVPMSRLRASISIIPQDPILFSGTIRSNLDPFNEFSDEEIWDVLRRASMKDRVSSLDEQLDAEIHENGSNLSVGVRLHLHPVVVHLRVHRLNHHCLVPH
jgi:ATP-binding cassette subfamily C (CFTR/MRP) protein 5